ncbi:contractile injection system tape measure protein [Streptomyces sp. JNUCC 63]
MTDVAVDTLRLRGPHARRLAAVAARALPAALERALTDVGDVHVDEIVVELHVDVPAHDDETLAVLWADAIRAQVLAVRREPTPDSVCHTTARDPVGTRSAGPLDVLAALRALGAAGAGPGTPLPRAVLALADPGTARAVAEAAGAQEWASLLGVLSRALRLPEPGGRPGAVPAAPVEGCKALAPDLLPAPEAARAGAENRTAKDIDATPEGTRLPGRPGELPDVLAVLARLVGEHSPAAETAAVSRVAGLALLYPWLAEHCRRAEDLHPGLDGREVREAALAAIADPDDPALADDPLVALLAGRGTAQPGRIRLPLPRSREVAESAVRVLTAFIALVPGFERSSPAFVRDSWITRLGIVDAERCPVLLTAAARPLDVVLARLPYPVGLIKLPWSPPLTVRFRP